MKTTSQNLCLLILTLSLVSCGGKKDSAGTSAQTASDSKKAGSEVVISDDGAQLTITTPVASETTESVTEAITETVAETVQQVVTLPTEVPALIQVITPDSVTETLVVGQYADPQATPVVVEIISQVELPVSAIEESIEVVSEPVVEEIKETAAPEIILVAVPEEVQAPAETPAASTTVEVAPVEVAQVQETPAAPVIEVVETPAVVEEAVEYLNNTNDDEDDDKEKLNKKSFLKKIKLKIMKRIQIISLRLEKLSKKPRVKKEIIQRWKNELSKLETLLSALERL